MKIICSNFDIVNKWCEDFRKNNNYPPHEVIDGYLVSTLIRGIYYQNLSTQVGGEYIWHRMRDHVLSPISKLIKYQNLNSYKTHLNLAGIICFGAIMEKGDEEIIHSWSKNLYRLRTRNFRIMEENDDKKSLESAIKIAQKCNLEFKEGKLYKIVDKAMEYFPSLIGIAAGTFVSPFATPIAGESVELGVEIKLRPYSEKTRLAIRKAHRSHNIKNLAIQGAKRMFVVNKGDIS